MKARQSNHRHHSDVIPAKAGIQTRLDAALDGTGEGEVPAKPLREDANLNSSISSHVTPFSGDHCNHRRAAGTAQFVSAPAGEIYNLKNLMERHAE